MNYAKTVIKKNEIKLKKNTCYLNCYLIYTCNILWLLFF